MGWILLLLAIGLAMAGSGKDEPPPPPVDPPKNEPPKTPAEPKKADAAEPSSVPKTLSEYFDNPANRDVGAELVGWYTYGRGVNGRHWIRIDEYAASRDITEIGVPPLRVARYAGRFRWTVFMGVEGVIPLGTAIVETAGESADAGFDPQERIDAAHNEAIDEAAELAAEWIDEAFGGKS